MTSPSDPDVGACRRRRCGHDKLTDVSRPAGQLTAARRLLAEQMTRHRPAIVCYVFYTGRLDLINLGDPRPAGSRYGRSTTWTNERGRPAGRTSRSRRRRRDMPSLSLFVIHGIYRPRRPAASEADRTNGDKT